MRIKKALFGAILALFVIAIPLGTFAATFKEGTSVDVAKDEVIDDDFYTAGNDINIDGFLKGDLVAVGSTIDVSQDVGGDASLAGATISVKGAIWDDLRVAGSQISLDTNIGGDIFAAGSIVECSKNMVISGDAYLAGNTVKVLGNVDGKLMISANEVILDGKYKGDVKIWATKITLRENAKISGNLEYTSNKEVNKETGATIVGKTTRHDPAGDETILWGSIALTGAFFFWKLIWWLAGLIFLLLFIWMLPNFSVRTNHYLEEKPWKSLGIGLLTLILTPIVALILCLLLIGLPAGIVLIILYGLLIFVAKILFSLWVGRKIFWLFNRRRKDYRAPLVWSAIVGTLVVTIVCLIPVLGWFIKTISLWFMFGAVLLTGRLVWLNLKKRKIA
jgi:cytoskeletal protein CcmA (bactofilin family)